MEIDVEGAYKAYGYLETFLDDDNFDPNWTDSFKVGLYREAIRDALDMLDGTHARNQELAARMREIA